jgi:chorismate dehydratase
MLKVSCVSYLNAAPFVYGLQAEQYRSQLQLQMETPSQCAASFFNGNADVALVPVGALPQCADYSIITDYCIGAVNSVYSVCLFANEPVHSLKIIYLDTHSRTSAKLIQILTRNYWQIQPKFVPLHDNVYPPQKGAGYLLIGDKTFAQHRRFSHIYDLAEAWIAHTKLPFTFAVWLAQKSVCSADIAIINNALSFGIQHLNDVIQHRQSQYADVDVARYLTQQIDYQLDAKKREAMQLFLSKIQNW